jgi:hypothetical protein
LVAQAVPLVVQLFESLPVVLFTNQFGTVHGVGMIGVLAPEAPKSLALGFGVKSRQAQSFGVSAIETKPGIAQAACAISSAVLVSLLAGTKVVAKGRLWVTRSWPSLEGGGGGGEASAEASTCASPGDPPCGLHPKSATSARATKTMGIFFM